MWTKACLIGAQKLVDVSANVRSVPVLRGDLPLAELPGLPHFAAPEQSLGMVDPSAPGGRARQHISETCPVDGLDFIREGDDLVVIGALTTIRGIHGQLPPAQGRGLDGEIRQSSVLTLAATGVIGRVLPGDGGMVAG